MNFLLFASHIPLKKFQIYRIYHFLGLRLRLRLEVLFNSFLSYPIAFFKAHVPGFNRILLGFLLLFLLLWRLLSWCTYLLCRRRRG